MKKNEPDDLMPSNHTDKHVYLTKSIKFSMPDQVLRLLHRGDDDEIFRATHGSVYIITKINKPNEFHVLSLMYCPQLHQNDFMAPDSFHKKFHGVYLFWPLCGLILYFFAKWITIMWNLLIILVENYWWSDILVIEIHFIRYILYC